MDEKKIAIIISTYNQEKLLEICIDSLVKKVKYKNYKIYLVDDSGFGKIGKNIKKKFKFVNVIINKKNLGFSKSNNLGITEAINNYNPDYFLLLNDDAEIIQGDCLKKMIKIGENDGRIGVLGGKIVYPDLSLQNMGGYLKGWEIKKETDENKKKIFEVDHVMGAFFMIKKEVIEKIGLLDEIYSPYLLEDTDYCLRAKGYGYKIMIVPDVMVVHKKGKSIDTLNTAKKFFVRFKNDIAFSLRHMSLKNSLFRVFVYLPLVAILMKKNDIDELNLRNFVVRKDFILNLIMLFLSYIYSIINLKRIF